MSERTARDSEYQQTDQERRMREQKPAAKTTSSASDPSYAAPSDPLIEPKVVEPRVAEGYSTYTGAPYHDNPTALPAPPPTEETDNPTRSGTEYVGRGDAPQRGQQPAQPGRGPSAEQQPGRGYEQPTLPGFDPNDPRHQAGQLPADPQRPGQPTQLPAPERPRATPA